MVNTMEESWMSFFVILMIELYNVESKLYITQNQRSLMKMTLIKNKQNCTCDLIKGQL